MKIPLKHKSQIVFQIFIFMLLFPLSHSEASEALEKCLRNIFLSLFRHLETFPTISSFLIFLFLESEVLIDKIDGTFEMK